MEFTDTHTHIYSEEFDADRPEMVRRARENGVTTLLLPAIDSSYHDRMLKVAGEFPDLCRPMIGLHPTSVKGDFMKELAIVESYLAAPEHRFCAIGEVGIDLYWDRTYEAEQRQAFSHQLNLALHHDLPVVIHTRNSMEIALDILAEFNSPALRGVFHCYSGNTAQAKRAVSMGFLLGIGGVITYKNSGLQTVVESIGLEHLLLETDAPWLPPVPFRGQRNEPAYIPVIAAKIAELKNITPEEVGEATTANARKMFTI